MKAESKRVGNGDMMLTSPDGVPYSFSLIIRDAWPANRPSCSFEIKGNDPKTRLAKMCQYHLNDREHRAYLDFFEELTKDFGLRLPQNRKPAEAPTFQANYREVLSQNLAPGMLYGYGDPAVIRIEAGVEKQTSYYLLATSNDAPDAFPVIRSQNVVDWEFVGYVFPEGQKPSWASDGEGISDYWAPEMHWVKNEFRIYFVARDRQNLELCIGLARSTQPDGPFVVEDAPVLKGNVIDPHLFVENDDTVYLYWKEDNNDVWPRLLLDLLYDHPSLIATLFTEKEEQVTASFVVTMWPWARILQPMERFQAIQIFIETVIAGYTDFYDRLKTFSEGQTGEMQEKIGDILHSMKTPMYARQLSADGSGFVGERIKILENDLEWEAHLVEGMWVTKQAKKYYLFYAGNDFSTSQYGIGVAIADSPVGPFQKMDKQLLQSTATWWAPGHPSLVQDPTGEQQLFLHAYFPGKAGYKQFRALLSIPVTFTEEGVYLK